LLQLIDPELVIEPHVTELVPVLKACVVVIPLLVLNAIIDDALEDRKRDPVVSLLIPDPV
jgi:hypothetical protein